MISMLVDGAAPRWWRLVDHGVPLWGAHTVRTCAKVIRLSSMGGVHFLAKRRIGAFTFSTFL